MACLLFTVALALVACGTADTPAPEPAPAPAVEAPTAAQPAPTVAPAPIPATPTQEPPATDGIEVDAAVAGATLVQLVDPLDEPEFYCVDVPGFGANLNLQSALMAHTCKPGADDEIFAVNLPGPGNLVMPAYDLCLEANSAESPAQVNLRECSDSAMQQFEIDSEGALTLSGTGLCMAVSPEDGEPTGGPSHLRRELVLQTCGEAEPALSRWAFPGVSPG